MLNEDIEELYSMTPLYTPVLIVERESQEGNDNTGYSLVELFAANEEQCQEDNPSEVLSKLFSGNVTDNEESSKGKKNNNKDSFPEEIVPIDQTADGETDSKEIGAIVQGEEKESAPEGMPPENYKNAPGNGVDDCNDFLDCDRDKNPHTESKNNNNMESNVSPYDKTGNEGEAIEIINYQWLL
jgi:hypothetical protein